MDNPNQTVGPATMTGHSPQVEWMPPPPRGLCSPGLEYLTQIDQLLIHQQIEWLEVMTGFETRNRYLIKNALGQAVYFAMEESSCCNRTFCANARGFQLNIYDNAKTMIIKIERATQYGYAMNCFTYPRDEIRVYSPPGTLIGYVVQSFDVSCRRYEIMDENETVVLRLYGPNYRPGADYPFSIVTTDGSREIGKVVKQWSGIFKELCTNADNFTVKFPIDLDVKIKALILGSVFLIDFMLFENQIRNPNHGRNFYNNQMTRRFI